MDDPVPLVIDVPEMYWMISSRLIPMWALHVRASEIEVTGLDEVHRDSRVVCVPVRKRGASEGEYSPVFRRNVPGADVHCQLQRKPEGVWRLGE